MSLFFRYVKGHRDGALVYLLGVHKKHVTRGFMELKRGSHQVYELGYHIIFCTKYRHAVLDGAVGVTCKNVIAETCVAYGWGLGEIEVMPDHVHLFVSAPPQVSPAEIATTD